MILKYNIKKVKRPYSYNWQTNKWIPKKFDQSTLLMWAENYHKCYFYPIGLQQSNIGSFIGTEIEGLTKTF